MHPDNPIFASEDGFLTEKRIEDIIVVPVWKKVTIPSGLIKMSEYVCSICEELTEVEIPFGVEEIGEQAFYGCDKLENER